MAVRPTAKSALAPLAALFLAGMGAVPAIADTSSTGTAYAQSSGTTVLARQTFAASVSDESAVLVTGGELFLGHSTVTKSGDSSDKDASSFTGLNAGVLAESGGEISLDHVAVTTNGVGANGVFAYGSGSVLSVAHTTINADGDGAHGADATGGATMNLSHDTVYTTGSSSSAVATDRGGATVTVTGGRYTATGTRSAGIYSTGAVTATDAAFVAGSDKGAVIDGANSITLHHSGITGATGGFMVWNTLPFREGTAHVTIDGGSVTATAGDLFYVRNTAADISVSDRADLTAASGSLLNVDTASDVAFAATHQRLDGNVTASSDSTVAVSLSHSSDLTGTVTGASLALDDSSRWQVTGDSTLTALTGLEIHHGTVTNVLGAGHTVTYDASLTANAALGGRTYALAGGGVLTPSS